MPVGSAFCFTPWMFQGSRMSKDPKQSGPARSAAPKETLEDAVYRSSLVAGNDAIKRGNPMVTIPVTVAMYALFGIVAFQLAKQSQVVKDKLKTVGIDLSEQADAAPPPPPPPPPPPAPAPAPKPPTEEELFARLSLQDLIAQKPLDDVYFDYDKADLSEAARASLSKNATWLKKWTSVRVTVEGHADVRGTAEYNLALGERRANATRDYLGSLGLDLARVAMVSKGEEQPVCTEKTEDCYAKNRRGHLVITAK